MLGLRQDLACRQAVSLVTDYLEGALPRRQRRRLERHLAACPHCSEYLAQMQLLIREAGQVDPGDLSPEARQDLTDLYRRYVSGES